MLTNRKMLKIRMLLIFGLLMVLLLASMVRSAETDWGEIKKSVISFQEADIAQFDQSPMLDKLVEAEELPPVDDRLPEEPLVVKPSYEIGEYGGTLTVAGHEAHWSVMLHALKETPFSLERYRPTEETVPNFAKGWEFSNEGKTLTVFLRKGLKWSDGHPFTAEDFTFAWEDIVNNKELTPSIPSQYKPVQDVEAVDPYTVKYTFDKTYYAFLHRLDNTWGKGAQDSDSRTYAPAHFLKRYHIKYNSDANELAKEEGYDYWYELFNHYYPTLFTWTPKEVPTLAPWILEKEVPGGALLARNPYYYKVDPRGNQLPYMDKVLIKYFTKTETHVSMLLSGEVDWDGWQIPFAEFPTLKRNEDEGNYNIWIGNALVSNEAAYHFNMTYTKDPALAEVLRKRDFRKALSLAINRQEINLAIFLGQGEPRQFTVHPSVPGYREEWAEAFAEYDPQTARDLLDEAGLKDINGDGWREDPDGNPLAITITVPSMLPTCQKVTELVVEYWKDVGVKTSMEVLEWSYYEEKRQAGEIQVYPWVVDVDAGNAMIVGMAYWTGNAGDSPAWENWLNTDGESGTEPPAEVKRLYELSRSLPFVAPERYAEIIQEIGDIQSENIWSIGTVGLVGSLTYANKDLGNVRVGEPTTGDSMAVSGVGGVNWLEQYYWTLPEKRQE